MEVPPELSTTRVLRGVTKAASVAGAGTASVLAGFSTPARMGLMLGGLVTYNFITKVLFPLFDVLGTCLQERVKRAFDGSLDRGS